MYADLRVEALPVITAFSCVDQLVEQLWTLGATKEVCSQLLSETAFPFPEFAIVWHVNCTTLLASQLTAEYSPASTAGGGSSASEAAVQQQQEGSMAKSPKEL